MMPKIKKNQGTVLILVLWTLGLLTVFAVYIGISVRQQVMLLSRLERRETLRTAAQSGVKKAVAFCQRYFSPERSFFSVESKAVLVNNPQAFQQFRLGRAVCDVRYSNGEEPMFGFIDEESKINLNVADAAVMGRLLQNVLSITSGQADEMARAIVDWRENGDTELVGFNSESFYERLEFPYKPKKANFETLDELLLVRGIDDAVYSQLKDFVTIYGAGRVNINTASPQALTALGMTPGLRQKILLARRGLDQKEATADDMIFTPFVDIVMSLSPYVLLKPEEVAELNALLQQGLLGFQSEYFRIQAKAGFFHDSALATAPSEEIKTITAVFQMKDAKIIYWREE